MTVESVYGFLPVPFLKVFMIVVPSLNQSSIFVNLDNSIWKVIGLPSNNSYFDNSSNNYGSSSLMNAYFTSTFDFSPLLKDSKSLLNVKPKSLFSIVVSQLSRLMNLFEPCQIE